MRISTAIAVATLFISSSAFAQSPALNNYSGARGALVFDTSVSGKSAPYSADIDANLGGGVSLYWGWRLPSNFNVELELLYRDQSLSKATVSDGTTTASVSFGGSVQIFAPMVNATYNIPIDMGFTPFVGGGVGYAWNEASLSRVDTVTFSAVHNDSWRFAYNLMAGIRIPLTDNSHLTGMYRWLREDIDLNCDATIQCSGNANSQSFEIGLDFDF